MVDRASSERIRDCLFIGIVVLFSAILYIRDLGFYSDDWANFGCYITSPDQSLMGPFRACNVPHLWMRPVQTLYFVVLYWLFGLHPLGYHLFNQTVFLLGIILFYLSLRILQLPRPIALGVPLVYSLSPHYSTDRFWYLAFAQNLSMTFYFLSLYSDLRMVDAGGLKVWRWKLFSTLALLCSTLAYEIFIPLFFLNPVLSFFHRQQGNSKEGPRVHKLKFALLIGSNLILLLGVVMFKVLTSTRLQTLNPVEHAAWFLKFMTGNIRIGFGTYGIGLPFTLNTVIRNYPDHVIFAGAGLLGVIIFVYLYRAQIVHNLMPGRAFLRKLIGCGLIVFGLGYAIFLTNRNAWYSSTGVSNRIAIAGTLGVALAMVGGIGWISRILRSDRWQRVSFACLVAFYCSSGYVINCTIANFWIQASQRQQDLITDLQRHFPSLPHGSTLLFDGICPFIGPAVVFECNYDVAGVLQVLYHDSTLRGDLVKPVLKISENGLHTVCYGFESVYPYNKLFIYNFEKKVSQQLIDAKSAARYFETYNPFFNLTCPEGQEGFGVPVL